MDVTQKLSAFPVAKSLKRGKPHTSQTDVSKRDGPKKKKNKKKQTPGQGKGVGTPPTLKDADCRRDDHNQEKNKKQTDGGSIIPSLSPSTGHLERNDAKR